MSDFDFTSPSKFFDSVSKALTEKAHEALALAKDDILEGVEVEPDEEDDLAILRNLADSVKLTYSIEVEDGEGTMVIDDTNEQSVIDAFFDLVDAQDIPFDVDSDDDEYEYDEIDSVDESTTSNIDGAKKGAMYVVKNNKENIEIKNKKDAESALGYSLSNKDWDLFLKLGHYRVEPTVELFLQEARLLKRTKPLDKLKRKNKYRKNKAKIKLSQKKFRRTASFKKYKAKAKRLGKLGKTSSGKRQTRRS